MNVQYLVLKNCKSKWKYSVVCQKCKARWEMKVAKSKFRTGLE